MSPTDTRLPTLLAVDDDPTTRKLVQAVLSKQGYRVLLAPDGQAGVEAFTANRPDLILMDVQMPGMNGFDACGLVRQLDGDATPIIMLTGSEDLESIERAFNAGATDFITKPINFPLLAQRVRYALRSSQLNRELRGVRQRQAAARRIAGLGFWDWNAEANTLEWSDDATDLLGDDLQLPTTLADLLFLVHPADRNRVGQAFQAVRETGGKLDVEFRLPDGEAAGERIITMTGERAEEDDPMQPVRVFGAFQNVTDSRHTQAMVDYLALHDELTGLANRRLFVRQIRDFFAAPETAQAGLLVGWIDLARFNRVNEALGESSGDALLAQVAQRLKSASASAGHVGLARVGGDEFGLALRCRSEAEAEDKLQRTLQALDLPFVINDQEVFVSVCAGWTLSMHHGQEPEPLINQAMDAQQQARSQGFKTLKAPQSASPSRSFGSLDVELDLRKALQSQQFCLHYQPQMALRGNRIVGVESLLRWQHPVRGMVPPVQFIPVLEDMGLIHEVGAWVMGEACRQAKVWSDAGMPLRVAINLSPRQFMGNELFGQIEAAVQAHQTPRHLVELEITEGLAMQDPDRAIELLTRLRAAGYKVAIDDFGIGYSSLEYLLRFPIDTIKIDRAFVMRVTDTETDRAVIRAITAIAQSLQLTTIAEGVETQRQCDFMEALGASEIQGYFISKPLPEPALTALVRDFKHAPG
ncbi:MAG: EAL domain-containing protein [Burkholderiaceae bacterium]|nr:EAL domain-containing protein [Burkholderiaceae bacterium]MDZ4163297.1 EAL domain-containing protein [Burkholderiales bacterium]